MLKGKMMILGRGISQCSTTDFAGTRSELSDILRGLVGGWLEIVHPQGLERPYMMVVDEEGKLKENNFINMIGSELYNCKDRNFDPIVGTAVIIKEVNTDEGPDFDVLTDEECSALSKKLLLVMKDTLGYYRI